MNPNTRTPPQQSIASMGILIRVPLLTHLMSTMSLIALQSNYNDGHDILRLLHGLPNFPLITSERKDCYN